MDYETDIAIIGGGTGGVAAALGALAMGKRVVMTEPTKWIGGQLTAQAVPPDENPAITHMGGTRRYRIFREKVRQFYLDHYPLIDAVRAYYRDGYPPINLNPWHGDHGLNPGRGGVSALCADFRVMVAMLESMLQPYLTSGQLRLLTLHDPVSAETSGDRVETITVRHSQTGVESTIRAPYILDATEEGDLLPLTGTEYRTGFESQAMTEEPFAPGEYQPRNQQAVSWCFAIEWKDGGNGPRIEKPAQYDFWRDYIPEVDPPWPGKLLSFTDNTPMTLETRHRHLRWDLWSFRRVSAPELMVEGTIAADITLINWPQIDYFLGPITDVEPDERAKNLEGAKQLSLSWLYWLQNEAPRKPDEGGGHGYPEVSLRADITGDAPHGLALTPYIRESRRIEAEFTVLQQHIARDIRRDEGAVQFPDSVGIGHYNIDLHPSTGGNNYIDVRCCPFQIPLGALLPKRVDNLLPACKNLGVTHITNGAYRLHPVEWNIGEAAGILAAHCLDTHQSPRAIRHTAEKLEDFQTLLKKHGISLKWPRVFADPMGRPPVS